MISLSVFFLFHIVLCFLFSEFQAGLADNDESSDPAANYASIDTSLKKGIISAMGFFFFI